MTAPTGLTHIEQAKQHLRNVQHEDLNGLPIRTVRAFYELLWAVDEVIRYVDPSKDVFPPGVR